MDTERYVKCGATVKYFNKYFEICSSPAVEFVVEGSKLHSRCSSHSVHHVLNAPVYHSLQDALAALAMEVL